MWIACFWISIGCWLSAVAYGIAVHTGNAKKRNNIEPFHLFVAGVFTAAVTAFIPICVLAAEPTFWGTCQAVTLTVFNAIRLFMAGCDFSAVTSQTASCEAGWTAAYQAWMAVLFTLAPACTFGFVLSLFKNLSAYGDYLLGFFKETYIFSDLNEKSLALASDIKKQHPRALIVFTNVNEDDKEQSSENIEEAKRLGAVRFKKDILSIDFRMHAADKTITFFTIGGNETENVNQAIKLIEMYRDRKNTELYVFSVQIESELLLTAIDKGNLIVRRVNTVRSLINSMLYEEGQRLFDSALEAKDGSKCISAVIVGLGRHGTEMLKALSWFGQMDGYTLKIHAFDKNPLAKETFTALAPELMSPENNGVAVAGEAQYTIDIHGGVDVETTAFSDEIAKITDATYVMVMLGDDAVNINTAVNLRMYFERMRIHPMIQAVVYNSEQKRALQGIKNFGGQPYDIDFIGDVRSIYTKSVLLASELETKARKIHENWGEEETFWAYEYNYRSSVASAIHMKARILCGIPGAAKAEEELTKEERDIIESLEHRRWNAYMRAEGFMFSGSTAKSSRNDLAKWHHDLVPTSLLPEEEKRIDSRVGTK